MAKRVPFDDRINHHANIEDLNVRLIRSFLEEICSDLRSESAQLSLVDLGKQLRIVDGPSESLLPLNVGLLFFSDHPEKHFKGAKTDVVIYQDLSGMVFIEKTFTGPIQVQLKEVLSFLQTNVIKEKVIKSYGKAETARIYNFPFPALEEVVANAFYHRSYEHDSPIEINCFPDRIEVLSFPGPLPPVTKELLKRERRIVARVYRNRRVGDFLKELSLTEGRATGFPTIYNSMEQNGSPKPKFETDDNYNYFLAILPVHPEFKEDSEEAKEIELQILLFCLTPRKRSAILLKIGFSNHHRNYQKFIVPLIEKGWLTYTLPELPRSPNQQYVTTEKGKRVLG